MLHPLWLKVGDALVAPVPVGLSGCVSSSNSARAAMSSAVSESESLCEAALSKSSRRSSLKEFPRIDFAAHW